MTIRLAVADLIARLEQASEPSLAAFKAVYATVFGWPQAQSSDEKWEHANRFSRFCSVGAWTDAAIILVPEGWWLTLQSRGQYHHAALEYVGPDEIECSEWSETDGDEVNSHNRPHPALALAIAALKAGAAP